MSFVCKRKSSFGLLFTVLSSVLFQLKMEDKGQILVLILLLASVFPCDYSFLRIPWVMNKLEANFTYLETVRTLCLSQCFCRGGVQSGQPLCVRSPHCPAGRIFIGFIPQQSQTLEVAKSAGLLSPVQEG